MRDAAGATASRAVGAMNIQNQEEMMGQKQNDRYMASRRASRISTDGAALATSVIEVPPDVRVPASKYETQKPFKAIHYKNM